VPRAVAVQDYENVMLLFCVKLSFDVALSFKYVVEQQPIGRELFREFCDTKPHLKKAIDFLDVVVSCSSCSYVSLTSLYPAAGGATTARLKLLQSL